MGAAGRLWHSVEWLRSAAFSRLAGGAAVGRSERLSQCARDWWLVVAAGSHAWLDAHGLLQETGSPVGVRGPWML